MDPEKDGKKEGDEKGKEGEEKSQQLYTDGMAAVLKAMQQMNTNMEGLVQTQQAVVEKLDLFSTAGVKSSNSEGEEEDEGDVEIEHMSNRELAAHIQGGIGKQLEKIMTPFKDMIEKTSNTSERTAAAVEAKEVAERHKDFWHFKDEMVRVAKENPQLSVERIYHLAKAENPERVAKVTEQLTKEEKGDEKSEETGAGGFGGFTPTSGKSQISDEGKEGKLDKISAAESAWSKVVPGGSPLATLNEGVPVEGKE